MTGPRHDLAFDRSSLLAAFDEIGAAANANGERLELAVYGGSALMLAGNFRFATEDVDIAEIGHAWPQWLSVVVAGIAERNGWSSDWMNDAVTSHLSPLAGRASDHIEFGAFPRNGSPGLNVVVPSPEYMLALKLKAMRTLDVAKGQQESDDIFNLMRVLRVDAQGAIALFARFFPRSASDTAKQAFLLKHLQPSSQARRQDAPAYGG